MIYTVEVKSLQYIHLAESEFFLLFYQNKRDHAKYMIIIIILMFLVLT